MRNHTRLTRDVGVLQSENLKVVVRKRLLAERASNLNDLQGVVNRHPLPPKGLFTDTRIRGAGSGLFFRSFWECHPKLPATSGPPTERFYPFTGASLRISPNDFIQHPHTLSTAERANPGTSRCTNLSPPLSVRLPFDCSTREGRPSMFDRSGDVRRVTVCDCGSFGCVSV